MVPACQSAFETLLSALSPAPVLSQPDYHLPFTIETDASDSAVGAVLSQKFPTGTQPISFYSRRLSSSERNYTVYDKELLAIVEALRQWRHYVHGSKYSVHVLTDHKNLQYFQSSRLLNQRQIRWSEFLTGFNLIITYRPAVEGVAADALSRSHKVTFSCF